MVEGSFEMWKNKRRTMNAYKQQISQFGTNTIGTSDLSATLIGNDQELQKRINKIFDNICENDYCRKEGIKSPGNLSKYLPEQTMELLPEVRAEIESGVKEKPVSAPISAKRSSNPSTAKPIKRKTEIFFRF